MGNIINLIWPLIFFLSCSSIKTASYDEEIYKRSQDLQKQMNLFLDDVNKGGSKAKLSKKDIKFYSSFETELNQISDKAKVHQNNDESINVLKTIKETFHQMKEMHKKSGLSKANIMLFKRHFSHQFKSLLDIERFKMEKEL